MLIPALFLLIEHRSNISNLKEQYNDNKQAMLVELRAAIGEASRVLDLIEAQTNLTSSKEKNLLKYSFLLKSEELIKYTNFFTLPNIKHITANGVQINLDLKAGIKITKHTSKNIIVGEIDVPYITLLQKKHNLYGLGSKLIAKNYQIELPIKSFQPPSFTKYLTSKKYMILLLFILYITLIFLLRAIYFIIIQKATDARKTEYNSIYQRLGNKITENTTLKQQINNYQRKLSLLKNTIISRLKFTNEIYPQPYKIKSLTNISKSLTPQQYFDILNKVSILFDLTKLPNRVGPCDIKEVVEQATTMLGFEAYDRNIIIKTSYINSFNIESDYSKLVIIFYNLLKRAIKRTPENTEVNISIDVLKTKLHVVIKDNGFTFFEEEIKKMLLCKEIRDNISVELKEVVNLASSINSVVEESLGSGGNEIELLLPMKLNTELRSKTNVVQIF